MPYTFPMSRLSKQLLYGGIYLAILGLAAAGSMALLAPPASCTDGRQNGREEGVDCGQACNAYYLPSDLAAINVREEPRVFHPTSNTVAAYARIENANPGVGAKSFDFKFDFYDVGGTKVGTKFGRSYIYAGEIKYLVVIAELKGAATALKAEVSVTQPDWVPDTVFPRPEIALQDKSARADARGLHATGKIVNRDTSALTEAEAIAIFQDHAGSPLGVSSAGLAGFEPGEAREFAVGHPPLQGADPERTQFFIYGKRP